MYYWNVCEIALSVWSWAKRCASFQDNASNTSIVHHGMWSLLPHHCLAVMLQTGEKEEAEIQCMVLKFGGVGWRKKGWECLLTRTTFPVRFAPRWRSWGNVSVPFIFLFGISGGTYATMLELCLLGCVLANVFCVPSLFNLVLWALLCQIYPSQCKTTASTQLPWVPHNFHSLCRLKWLLHTAPEQPWILNRCSSPGMMYFVLTGMLAKGCTWLLQEYGVTRSVIIRSNAGNTCSTLLLEAGAERPWFSPCLRQQPTLLPTGGLLVYKLVKLNFITLLSVSSSGV